MQKVKMKYYKKYNNPGVCTLKKTGNDYLDNLIDRLLSIDQIKDLHEKNILIPFF